MSSKKTILVVDDESDIRELFERVLEERGFHCIGAKNGKEGLEMIQKQNPDVVLLDIQMPLMGGVEMLEELRKAKDGKRVPVIILTNVNDESYVAKAMDLGAYDFLEKSRWDIDGLVKRINEKLKESV